MVDWSDASLVMIRSIESTKACILEELYTSVLYEGKRR